ncbi:hypothetical protein [Stenotrophomonas sp.]|uniref:hypothetical protein n=1 Tax=Stenotrophomonas sp. TaxID=69392 RepID=UPI00289D2FEF|nr:hypothetical protein [Stenotrophomonas sp.]
MSVSIGASGVPARLVLTDIPYPEVAVTVLSRMKPVELTKDTAPLALFAAVEVKVLLLMFATVSESNLASPATVDPVIVKDEEVVVTAMPLGPLALDTEPPFTTMEESALCSAAVAPPGFTVNSASPDSTHCSLGSPGFTSAVVPIRSRAYRGLAVAPRASMIAPTSSVRRARVECGAKV